MLDLTKTLNIFPIDQMGGGEKFLAVAFALSEEGIGVPIRPRDVQAEWPQHVLNSSYSPSFYPMAKKKKWVLPDRRNGLGAFVVTQAGANHLKQLGGNVQAAPILKGKGEFVDEDRLVQLRGVSSTQYDLSRLICMCEEINDNFLRQNYTSTVLLLRALLDHVAPILGFTTFIQVANNSQGSRSLKDSLQHLENSSRKIADGHLHTPIRKAEVLPTKAQVNFSQDLDVLLGEIVRLLK